MSNPYFKEGEKERGRTRRRGREGEGEKERGEGEKERGEGEKERRRVREIQPSSPILDVKREEGERGRGKD